MNTSFPSISENSSLSFEITKPLFGLFINVAVMIAINNPFIAVMIAKPTTNLETQNPKPATGNWQLGTGNRKRKIEIKKE